MPMISSIRTEDNNNGPIDIVELPPERVDEMSDNEDFDDNIIDDEEPSDVPEFVEIHHATGNNEPAIGVDQSAPSTSTAMTDSVPPPTKKRMTTLTSNWKKRQPSYSKIRPIIDQLNEKFLQYGVFSENVSIDEQMVRYYGHHYLKQFIRETPEVHKVYFDNFFTGFAFMKHLQDVGVRATGTARFNRMNKCPIATDKEMKKKDKGAYDYKFDMKNEILAVMWNDNSCVRLLSNHEPIEPVSQTSEHLDITASTALKWGNRGNMQCVRKMQGKNAVDAMSDYIWNTLKVGIKYRRYVP
ncbi:hypothetical protein J437_LFUL019154 [Ladona fulva]|uniref:PiggyBac transposable element-derived protein domain-containing protein n=1 Tax=Ladona fulva TaxID=123851 RepID=A0A8K0KQJ8_LADFU|nr:hypothetical protein J437_LFUL019154 [Ladona fulva]